ncbi:MAG: SAM-dependent methyltransferase [Ignavibacteria bacterium]|nr:SAM-dependent methyltransferase [Ignavibacteria bacterium]
MEIEKQKFIDHLKKSIEDNSFVKITFGKYRGGDPEFQNVYVTKIEIKEGERLSFKFRYKTKDIVKNYEIETGIRLADEILGKDFFSATLFTTSGDYSLDYSKKRIPQLHTKKASFTSPVTTEHNKSKSRFVDQNAKYFQLLGITTSDGKVKADSYDKFRQVDKFIGIVDSLYRSSRLSDKNEIKIADMGSGKSYMTFALYDYFSNTLNKNVFIKGIEQREELIKLSNRIAVECKFTGLKFETGVIEDFKTDETDIVVALHACDTATDDAIVKAVQSDAEIIVLAPCCQKYVRKKLASPASMKGIYKHGIMMERLAVSVTDGLRALMMEYFGYDTKVFEFISSEHTAKNTMITAVKKDHHIRSDEKLEEINLIKREFQLDDFYLDRILLNTKAQRHREE